MWFLFSPYLAANRPLRSWGPGGNPHREAPASTRAVFRGRQVGRRWLWLCRAVAGLGAAQGGGGIRETVSSRPLGQARTGTLTLPASPITLSHRKGTDAQRRSRCDGSHVSARSARTVIASPSADEAPRGDASPGCRAGPQTPQVHATEPTWDSSWPPASSRGSKEGPRVCLSLPSCHQEDERASGRKPRRT